MGGVPGVAFPLVTSSFMEIDLGPPRSFRGCSCSCFSSFFTGGSSLGCEALSLEL